MNDDAMERLRADLIRRAERIRESKLDESGDEESLSRTRSQPSTPTTFRQQPRQSSAPSVICSERRSKVQTISGQPELSDFGRALGWLHESPWIPPPDASPLFSQYLLPMSPPKAAFLSEGYMHPALERHSVSRPPRNAMEASHLRHMYVESLQSDPSVRPSTSSSMSFFQEKLARKWTRTSSGMSTSLNEGEEPKTRSCILCFPWSSPDTRAYSIQCLASGLFLAADLSI
ncbi:hypothetical protein ESCO_005746 [Escovopsis weberi]|uniref:Uncharacterized protein n=1 Tax=Escovopsis weberi TaxID=150374 RepID=A0A0M8MWH3_ESCWE|nr:hypothetical protein ESCO_005746 [Escovopsis weberi]